MLDSPDISLPDYEDAELDAMLDMAKRRANLLRHNHRRRQSITGALAIALLVAVVAMSVLRFDGPTAGGSPGRNATPHRVVFAAPSWKLVSDLNPPSWQEPPSSGYAQGEGLTCPTATTCYLEDLSSGSGVYPFSGPFASQVEVTHDGGESWRQSTLPDGVEPSTAFACVDAETCALFGRDSSGTYVFVTTDDGGGTWTSQPGPEHAVPPVAPGVELVDFTSLSCTTATSCVAVGPVDGASSPSFAAVTTNGGTSWSQSEIAEDFSALGVECVVDGNCITTGYDTGSESSPAGTAFYSSDGGSSWTASALPASIGPVNSVSCADGSDCLASTFPANGSLMSDVLVSIDGGQSWTLSAAQGLEPSLLSSTSCATSSYCWASGAAIPPGSSSPINFDSLKGLLTMTDDQGASWTTAQLPPSVDVNVVDAVSCPTSSTCFALGYQSTKPGQTTGSFVFLSYGS